MGLEGSWNGVGMEEMIGSNTFFWESGEEAIWNIYISWRWLLTAMEAEHEID
jgi:hypothetical protein